MARQGPLAAAHRIGCPRWHDELLPACRHAGNYAVAVRHDKNGNGSTDISSDGGGFSNNPSISVLNLGKPSVGKVSFYVGSGVTTVTINMKYM